MGMRNATVGACIDESASEHRTVRRCGVRLQRRGRGKSDKKYENTHRPNQTEVSCRPQERAGHEVKRCQSSLNVNLRRAAVSSTDWLDVTCCDASDVASTRARGQTLIRWRL
jgi:hypothetical protein